MTKTVVLIFSSGLKKKHKRNKYKVTSMPCDLHWLYYLRMGFFSWTEIFSFEPFCLGLNCVHKQLRCLMATAEEAYLKKNTV